MILDQIFARCFVDGSWDHESISNRSHPRCVVGLGVGSGGVSVGLIDDIQLPSGPHLGLGIAWIPFRANQVPRGNRNDSFTYTYFRPFVFLQSFCIFFGWD